MIKAKLIVIMAISVVFSGCTSFYSLSIKQKENPQNFNEYLTNGYYKLAMADVKRFQFSSADYFAEKGVRAANGQDVMPEALVYWSIRDPQRKKELVWGAKRLTSLLFENTDARKRYPAQLAEAQVMYDCWVQQSEEGLLPANINQCRLDFLMAVAAIENRLLFEGEHLLDIPADTE